MSCPLCWADVWESWVQRGECSVLGVPPPAVLGCHHLSRRSVQGWWQGRGPSTSPVPAVLGGAGQPRCQGRAAGLQSFHSGAMWSCSYLRGQSPEPQPRAASPSLTSARGRLRFCFAVALGSARFWSWSCLSRGTFSSRPVLLPHPCGSFLCLLLLLLLIAAILRRG